MMMKKTTSALAVAALLGTGAASAATFQVNDDTTMSVYGDLQAAYIDEENEDTTLIDNASSFGFSGETTLDSGVTTFFNLEFDGFGSGIDFVGSNGTSTFATDEGHFGIRGDFGDIRFGKESAAYETLDGIFDYQWDVNTTSISPADRARVLQYRNSLGDVSYVVGAQINGGQQEETTGGSTTSVAGAATYDLGTVSLTAAYDQRANDTREDDNDNKRVIDEPIYGVAASFDVQTVSMSVGYQKDADKTNEADIVSLSASAPVGGVNLYGVYQTVSYDSAPQVSEGIRSISTDQTDDTFNEYIVGASYGVGPMVFAAEYVKFDNLNDENDRVSFVGYYGF
jgi:predicted porin